VTWVVLKIYAWGRWDVKKNMGIKVHEYIWAYIYKKKGIKLVCIMKRTNGRA
jgi:hypothetical protein